MHLNHLLTSYHIRKLTKYIPSPLISYIVAKNSLISRTSFLCYHYASSLLIRWAINTKYYNADVSVWMAHLHEDFSIGALPAYDQLVALVMVFDVTDVSQTLFPYLFHFLLYKSFCYLRDYRLYFRNLMTSLLLPSAALIFCCA